MNPDDDRIIPLAHGEHPPVPDAVKIGSRDFSDAHHSTRTKARKQALDVLFQADLRHESVHRAMARRVDQGEPELREFARQILEGYSAGAYEINDHIADALTGDWTLDRMSRIDRNLARIAVWELDFTAIDLKIAINEAMTLANELSTDESVAFLNGLLARIANERRGIQRTQEAANEPDPDAELSAPASVAPQESADSHEAPQVAVVTPEETGDTDAENVGE